MKERVLEVIDKHITHWESLRPYADVAQAVYVLEELRLEIVAIPEGSDEPQAD